MNRNNSVMERDEMLISLFCFVWIKMEYSLF